MLLGACKCACVHSGLPTAGLKHLVCPSPTAGTNPFTHGTNLGSSSSQLHIPVVSLLENSLIPRLPNHHTGSLPGLIFAGTHTLNLHICSSGWHHGHLRYSRFWHFHPPTGLLAFAATTDIQAVQHVVWLQSHPPTCTHERPSSRKRVKRSVEVITGFSKARLLRKQFSCFQVTKHYYPVLRFQNENSYAQNEHSKYQNKLGRTTSLSLSSILLGT